MSLLRRLTEEPRSEGGHLRYFGLSVGRDAFANLLLLYRVFEQQGYHISHHGTAVLPHDDQHLIISPYFLAQEWDEHLRSLQSGDFDGKIVYGDSGVVERMRGHISDASLRLEELGLDAAQPFWMSGRSDFIDMGALEGNLGKRVLEGWRQIDGQYRGLVGDPEGPAARNGEPLYTARNGVFVMEAIPSSFDLELDAALSR